MQDELESSHQSAESIAGQRMSGKNSVVCFSNVKIGPQILSFALTQATLLANFGIFQQKLAELTLLIP